MCDLLHQPFCVPHEALLQGTSPPPPSPPAAATAMRPNVGQHQQCHQAWVACSRCCISPSSTDCVVMLSCLNAPHVVQARFLNSFDVSLFPYYVLPRTTCAVHDFIRTCSRINTLLNKINCSRGLCSFFCPDNANYRVRHAAPHDFGACSTSVVC